MSSSGSGRRVTAVLRSDSTGRYYISVGSEGDGRIGVYHVRVIGMSVE